MYHARNTGQIVFAGEPDSPSLATHQFEGGEPICGAPLIAWRGQAASYADHGPGKVDCGHCKRVREARLRRAA